MKNEEKKKLKEIIVFRIRETKKEIEELKELVKPIPLDASIGRVSRMDVINNKSINELGLRDKEQELKKT